MEEEEGEGTTVVRRGDEKGGVRSPPRARARRRHSHPFERRENGRRWERSGERRKGVVDLVGERGGEKKRVGIFTCRFLKSLLIFACRLVKSSNLKIDSRMRFLNRAPEIDFCMQEQLLSAYNIKGSHLEKPIM